MSNGGRGVRRAAPLTVAALAVAGTTRADGIIDFEDAADHFAGEYTRSVAIGDLNGDGHPDLVAANAGGGDVSVLLNDGDGGSGDPDYTDAGSIPIGVATGDFDGDGRKDLVLGNTGAGHVRFLRNEGDGTFENVTASMAAGLPYSVAARDFDGDGHMDVAVLTDDDSSGHPRVVRTYLGDGAFGFGSATATVDAPGPCVAAADLDGDGRDDVIVVGLPFDEEADLTVHRATSDGGLESGVTFTVGHTPYYVARGDLDGDGLVDLAVGNSGLPAHIYGQTGTASISVLRNRSVLDPVTVELDAAADTYLRKGHPNQNQNDEDVIQVRSSGHNRALVRFDTSGLAEEADGRALVSATLRLPVVENHENWGTSGRDVAVHRMLVAWTEDGATWNSPDDQDTSNSKVDGDSWDMAASSASGLPYAATATDAVVHTNDTEGTVEWDVTADVAAFLAGTATNHGWLVRKVEEGQNGRMEYGSREYAGGGPVLVVVFEQA